MSPPAEKTSPVARPLQAVRVVVTRPAGQAGDLVSALRDLGAEPILESAIRIDPLEDTTQLDAALRRIGGYDWVVFTSRNGVEQVWARFQRLDEGLAEMLEDGEHGRRPGVPRVAAIGPGTAAALERRGVRPDFVPEEYVAEALAAGLPVVPGARVLCLRAQISRPALRELLTARGATVDDVVAYRTRAATSAASGGRVDAVTFTSPSTVREYLRGGGHVPPDAAVVCIGPVTARAAREHGLRVDAVAGRYTIAGLVEALVSHFAVRSSSAAANLDERSR